MSRFVILKCEFISYFFRWIFRILHGNHSRRVFWCFWLKQYIIEYHIQNNRNYFIGYLFTTWFDIIEMSIVFFTELLFEVIVISNNWSKIIFNISCINRKSCFSNWNLLNSIYIVIIKHYYFSIFPCHKLISHHFWDSFCENRFDIISEIFWEISKKCVPCSSYKTSSFFTNGNKL